MDSKTDDLKHIRSMMERSSKFLSLSGISGVSAGFFAAIGAIAAHFVLLREFSILGNLLIDLILIAGIVLLFAGSSGLYFSAKKARKSGSKLWMPVTMQILKDFSIPMLVGAVFSVILIYKHIYIMVAPSMLVFYGLSLIYAGARTYRDIKILGACEIVLGLAAGVVVGYDLVFWGVGFGLLHIVYGIVVYYKYDRMSK